MTLPQRAIGNLRAVASILAPPTPTSLKPKQAASFSLVEVSRPTKDSDEIPFMNEKSSSVSKVRVKNATIYCIAYHGVIGSRKLGSSPRVC